MTTVFQVPVTIYQRQAWTLRAMYLAKQITVRNPKIPLLPQMLMKTMNNQKTVQTILTRLHRSLKILYKNRISLKCLPKKEYCCDWRWISWVCGSVGYGKKGYNVRVYEGRPDARSPEQRKIFHSDPSIWLFHLEAF